MVRDSEPQRPLLHVTISEGTPPAETIEVGRHHQRRHRAAVCGMVAAGALVVALDMANHNAPQPKPVVQPVPSLPHPPPVTPPRCQRVGCNVADAPSRAIRSAFSRHIPGSIVVSERTVNRGAASSVPALRHRVVHAVLGNVEITVTVAPTTAGALRLSGPARQIARDGYLIGFDFVGFYPPPGAQLRALANDSRLTSVRS